MTGDDSGYKYYTASIDLAIIDKKLGTTISGTTNLPKTIYERPTEERDNIASQLIVKKNKQIKESPESLAEAVHRVLENPDSSEQLTSGNLVIVMNSNIYGSSLTGDVHQPNITIIQEWNQIKNDIDIEALKTEIEQVIDLMQKKASESEHYSDLANLSFARDELKKADGPAMLKYLKKVGGFGLDIIKGAGSSILATILLGI